METTSRIPPAIIKITPMTCRLTCAGFQVMPKRRIAPIMMSATLPPMVTANVTSFRAGPQGQPNLALLGPYFL